MTESNDTTDNDGRKLLLDAYAAISGSSRPSPSAAACPSWCDVEHPAQRRAIGGYHHDGEAVSIDLSPDSIAADDTEGVYVKPALFVTTPDDDRGYLPQVEVQTSEATVLELAIPDARRLAEAIVHVCDVAEAG